MGFFTWTDARRYPAKTKCGDWHLRDIIHYGGYAKIVLPDNSTVETDCYDGYGLFGEGDSVDAYDVVVDMNKPYLPEIMEKLKKKSRNGKFWGSEYSGLACCYARDDIQGFEREMDRLRHDLKLSEHMLTREWKRTIGIAIACEDENNASLPFPLKITSSRRKVKYANLVPSFSTQ